MAPSDPGSLQRKLDRSLGSDKLREPHSFFPMLDMTVCDTLTQW